MSPKVYYFHAQGLDVLPPQVSISTKAGQVHDEYDPFPYAPRLNPLKAILAKLEPPKPQPKPPPPLARGMGPRVGRGRSRTYVGNAVFSLFAAYYATMK